MSPGGDGRGDLFRDSEGEPRTGTRLLTFALGFVALGALGVWLVPVPGMAGQSVVFLVAGLAVGWFHLDVFHDRPPGALGFYLDGEAVGESVRGLLLGIGTAAVAVAAMAATGAVRWTSEAGTAGELVREGLWALGFLAVPAAAEEALFRGYPLQALARDWGPLAALVATSVGFGLLHLANPGITAVALVNLIAAGAFLGVVYLRTGSLWWATGAHLGWNWSLGFLADLPVSGLELIDAPLWEGVSQGGPWLSGGAFGPEGSVLTTGVVAVATAVLWRSGWLSPGDAARDADPLTPLPNVEAPGSGASTDRSERTKRRREDGGR